MSMLFAATYPERTWGPCYWGATRESCGRPTIRGPPTAERYLKDAELSLASLFGPRERAVQEISEWLGG
jgi:hypothetical protein